jgi:hypothetical protein
MCFCNTWLKHSWPIFCTGAYFSVWGVSILVGKSC